MSAMLSLYHVDVQNCSFRHLQNIPFTLQVALLYGVTIELYNSRYGRHPEPYKRISVPPIGTHRACMGHHRACRVTIEPARVTIEPARVTIEPARVTIEPAWVTIEPARVTIEPAWVT